MKIKIKEQGKTKEFKLINSWSDVSLERWLKLIEFQTGSKTQEAEETIAAMSDIPKQLINQLSLKDVAVIMEKISELQAGQDSSLKKIIEIEGVEYGFHPNLDEITLGEYADLETFIKMGIEQHLPEVMAVLYRKVTEKTDSGVYTIEKYGGDLTIRAEKMKKMTAEQVQSALQFFFAFVSVLSKTLGLFLTMKQKEMKTQSSAKV
jgi:hypothetical protein|tara:strand:- start:728 stop:1345 length:618 start_codon:yes stop_codon:yes gene_type:complete